MGTRRSNHAPITSTSFDIIGVIGWPAHERTYRPKRAETGRFGPIRAEHVHLCEIFENSCTRERARKRNIVLGGPASGTHDWTRALFGSCRGATWLQWGDSSSAGPACVVAAT